ncbi:ABC transporter substrate-binding protein [Paenibacillus sp. 481]|uniref:ABC transporter substrate-binding protein n=1 Tax=Paenibacillus sp. 481 TaxID=2835869 RepID=UPI001E44D9ED|nr:extracellular solute-binding protein [Paenibacillus sp. 481]UHA74094.1 extracellular solute-binding protein [Paenibacillus sp. 481]
MNKTWGRKLLLLTLVMTMVFPLLAACTKGEDAQSGQERVLRIGVMRGSGDDSWFRSQYTDMFEFSNKGKIKFEIVPIFNYDEQRYTQDDGMWKEPNYTEGMKKLMNSSNPVDIVYTSPSVHRALVQEGMVKDLEALMQQSKVDMNKFVPAVVDSLKALGDGKMYGFAPTYYPSALVYNKTMFSAAGVEAPKDGMTWDELFQLARRMSSGEGKNRKYGFSFSHYPNDLSDGIMSQYVPPLNLRTYDDKAEKMMINSAPWKRVFETFARLDQEKIIATHNIEMDQPKDGSYNPIQSDVFLSGRAAMVIGEFNYINNEIDTAMKSADKIKGFKRFDWDIVSMPSHPEAPGVASKVSTGEVFAINQKATNSEDAWEFIKFVSGEDWAKLRSRSTYELVSHKDYAKPKQGVNYNVEALFKSKPMQPAKNSTEELEAQKPELREVTHSGYQIMSEVFNKKKTVEQGLQEWEKKGNELLQSIKKNANKKNTTSGG